ncbi:hypothetical protein ABFS83_14G308300 [Erythranthe nasuta]
MDMDQDNMRFLGLIGVYKESCKLIFRRRKLFALITLTLILPLLIVFLAEEPVSEVLYNKIRFNEFMLMDSAAGTPSYHKLSDLVSAEWTEFILLKAFYFAFVLVFSLLATSAVVYTVASAYTAKEVTFRKVIGVVPRVWRRLALTFLCIFFAFFAYNAVFGAAVYWWTHTSMSDSTAATVVFFVVVIAAYVVGFVYMTIVWQLASVVSVLEDTCGVKAVVKSADLIKGKLVVAVVVFVKLLAAVVGLYIVFVVVCLNMPAVVKKVGFGGLCLAALVAVVLFGLVVQTVIYFVCKSYHRQNIDKSALSDHLEAYSGGYVRLKASPAEKDVQLEEYRV